MSVGYLFGEIGTEFLGQHIAPRNVSQSILEPGLLGKLLLRVVSRFIGNSDEVWHAERVERDQIDLFVRESLRRQPVRFFRCRVC